MNCVIHLHRCFANYEAGHLNFIKNFRFFSFFLCSAFLKLNAAACKDKLLKVLFVHNINVLNVVQRDTCCNFWARIFSDWWGNCSYCFSGSTISCVKKSFLYCSCLIVIARITSRDFTTKQRCSWYFTCVAQ